MRIIKKTPSEPEMPFKTLVDKIDQMDLPRKITNNHKRLYEVNKNTSNINEDITQMSIACSNINELNQNHIEQFEGTICNVLKEINNTYDKIILKEDRNLHCSVVIAVHMDILKVDPLKDHVEKA